MKAERRHELKHNELSDWLGERMEVLQPHATGIVLGIILLAVILIGGAWYLGGKTQASSRAWSRYFEAFNDRDPQKSLENLAGDASGNKAAWWALLTVADMQLGQGSSLLFSDRTEAQKQLDQAKAGYLRVEAFDDPMLKTRARLGLAKVYESLCKPDEALKYYEQVAASEKDSAIGKSAAEAAARLKNEEDGKFLEWFAKQTPKRPAPMPGIGGNVPGMPGMSDLPSRPDIGLTPGVLEGAAPGVTSDASTGLPGASPGLPPPAEPTTEATAPQADQPPAESKPEDSKPAEPKAEAPKTDEPPATSDAAPAAAADKKPD
jgi:predicted negative regulator of RcsB-dependent stress response